MELIENLEHGLSTVVTLLKIILEALSVFSVLLGLIKTLQLAIAQITRRRSLSFQKIRLTFGSWLGLALEFQLGADILLTTIPPTFDALGKLGAIAVIRTFLNYFLYKELEAELESQSRVRELESPPEK